MTPSSEKVKKAKVTETPLVKISSYCEGVVEIRFKYDEYKVDVKSILEIRNAYSTLILEKEVKAKYILVIPGSHGVMTREARELELFERSASPDIKAVAIVVPTLHKRILAKFFFKWKKTSPPFKHQLFSDEKAAVDWLNKCFE